MKTFLSLVLSITSSLAYGQWTQTAGPGVGGVNIVFSHDGVIEAGTDIEGVYQSSDNGTTWSANNSGLEKTSVRSLGSNTTYLFAGVDFDNRGHGGVYRKSLTGTDWTPVNAGISAQTINALLVDGSTIYAGTIGLGVYKSTDNGDTWVQSNNGMGNEFVTAIVKNGNTLFASGSNNLYKSNNGGATWSFTNGGQYFSIFSMAVSGNFMYAGGFQGLIRSTDSGNTWSTRIDILIITSVTHLSGFAFKGSTMFATTSVGPGAGVIKSTDNGLTWSFANGGIETVSLNSILVASNLLITGGSSKGIVTSSNNGSTWGQSNSGLPPGGSVRKLLAVGDTVYTGTGGDGVYRTTNNGVTWESKSVDPNGVLKNAIVTSLVYKNGVLLAAATYDGVFRSTDNGESWIRSTAGIPAADQPLSLTESGSNVIVGTGSSIYYSSDLGLTWNPSNIPDGTASDLTADSGFAYANVITGFTSSGIYRSSNGGVTWTAVLTSLTQTIVGLGSLGQNVYAGCFCPGGVRSTNFGSSWLGYSISGVEGIYSLLPTGNVVYAGTGIVGNGIYQSTDFGATYTPFNEGFEPFTSVEALATANGNLFAGTNDRAVWRRSIAGGIPCDSIDLFQARCQPGGVVQARIVLLNSTGYAGEEVTLNIDGVDYPVTVVTNRVHSKAQVQVVLGLGSHTASLVDPPGCFDPITFTCSIARSNSGETWIWDDESEFTTGTTNTGVPDKSILFKNYPDPFNPSTTIQYFLARDEHVTLRIYNMLGQLVATLVDEPQRAGYQSVVWKGISDDGAPVASGSYIYRLTAGDFAGTGRMLIIK